MIKKKADKIDIYYWLVIFCIFLFLFLAGVRSCKMGTDSLDYEYICIEGHIYHTVNFGQKMAIAIKLDDEGRPIKCQQ